MSEEETMYNEICANCKEVRGKHYYHKPCNLEKFSSSGNVSVPASFIDKVRALCDGINDPGYAFGDKCDLLDAVREALAEIDKGE